MVRSLIDNFSVTEMSRHRAVIGNITVVEDTKSMLRRWQSMVSKYGRGAGEKPTSRCPVLYGLRGDA
jgi:hypothetical protein